jgi:NAD(P)-dependent dehydrogenase (short-subunit alcohol dehydrogenase family)
MTATVLITGASRGLGLEFAHQYAHEGADVIACCRSPEKAEKLGAIARQHKNIRIEMLDVTDEKSIDALAVKLKDTAIDILINNAGIVSGGSGKNDGSQDFGTIDPEAWDRVLRTNTIAPIMMTQAFAKQVARSRQRKIVMITSRMGSLTEMGGGYIAYRTSKAALNAAMRAILHNLGADNIIIANIHPGWVKTEMGGKDAEIDPQTSVGGMRRVIAGLSIGQSGAFLAYDGKSIAW